MNPDTSIKYAVYDLLAYFSSQPGDIKRCPVCNGALSKSMISPSKAVVAYLATATIGHHEFSHLYECSACQWWAVRESWDDFEHIGQTFDSLIVNLADGTERTNRRGSSWHLALEDVDVYRNEKPLPDTLGKLFGGGKKIRSDVLKPGDRVYIVAHTTKQERITDEAVTVNLTGRQGIVVSYAEYYAYYEQQLKEWHKTQELPIDEMTVQAKFQKVDRAKRVIEKGFAYAIRLEKLNSVSADRSGDRKLYKAGEVYLIEASHVKKID